MVSAVILLSQILHKLWMKKGPDCDYNKRNTWSSMRQIFRRSHVDTDEHTHILYFHKHHGNKDSICTTNIDCWSTASGKSAHGEVKPIQHYLISLLVTCQRSVVFCGYSVYLYQSNRPPRYNWHIIESGVKYQYVILQSVELLTT